MSAFPENALKLYSNFDYWECKELLDIYNSSKINPENKMQELENNKFNMYLDKKAYNKFKWMYISTPLNLYEINKKSKELIN